MASILVDSETDFQISDGCFPFGFWRELKQLFHLAWPTVGDLDLPLRIIYTHLIPPTWLLAVSLHPLSLPHSTHFPHVLWSPRPCPAGLCCPGHFGRSSLHRFIDALLAIGKTLASISLQVIYISTVSIGRGLAFGGDTFFSQVIWVLSPLNILWEQLCIVSIGRCMVAQIRKEWESICKEVSSLKLLPDLILLFDLICLL